MSVQTHDASARRAHRQRPFVIGLTGPIAAGKSTVAALLRKKGAVAIDADQVYRALLSPGSEVWENIVSRFGPAVLGRDGQINRAALGKIVFRDPEALSNLEQITHPPVVAEIRRQIANTDADVIVVEAVKLVESGLLADVDSLWFVTANPQVRARRLAERRGLSEREAHERLLASAHAGQLADSADVVLDNSGDMSLLAQAVGDAWRAIVEPARSFPRHLAASGAAKENA